jgi:uncharacterized tellurite resistance protein B-like protein
MNSNINHCSYVRVLLYLVCGLIGTYYGGLIGLLLGFFFGFLIWYFVLTKTSKAEQKQRRGSSSPPRFPHEESVSSQSTPSKPRHTWVQSGQQFEHAGYLISGMVYVSSDSPTWESEPSTIYLRQPVGTPLASSGRELPYWPSYANLLDEQRGLYLQWLAEERNTDDSSSVETGYLFLFFYGIERRILIDGDTDPRLIEAVYGILQQYAQDGRSRSLASYLGDFLHYVSYGWGKDYYGESIMSLVDICGEKVSELAMTLILGNLYEREEPLDWSLALRLAESHELSKRSVVVKRTGETFPTLFKKRFLEKYPAGLSLRAGKNPRKVSYRAANASLSYHNHREQTFTTQVPNVSGLRAQFKFLPQIWNECIDELSGFSRAIQRIGNTEGSNHANLLKAYLALPEDMRNLHIHPLLEPMNHLLEAAPKEGARVFVPVRALADLIELPDRPTFTSAQSTKIAELVDSLGYGIAPDPRLLGLPLAGTQEVVIIAVKSGVNQSAEVCGLMRLLYLSVAIAAADGSVDSDELEMFHSAVSKRVTDLDSLEILAATEAALLRDTRIASKLVSRIAKGVKPSNRPTVFRLLVHVASADEIITSDERRSLIKIANAFELPATLLDDILEEDREFATATVSGKVPPARNGEAIPNAAEEAQKGFSLDMARISEIVEETDQVVRMLADVLAEDEQADQTTSIDKECESSKSFPEWMETLDAAYRPTLDAILAEGETLASARLDEISETQHLLPIAVIDTINSWADEELGDFLLEGSEGGNFTIYREILPEILTTP